jgi:hypothetical protein
MVATIQGASSCSSTYAFNTSSVTCSAEVTSLSLVLLGGVLAAVWLVA